MYFRSRYGCIQITHINNKYNNAKRSIPAHPTFVNDTHRDLHLWTVTSKSNRGYHMVNMSAKFDEQAHNGLVCIARTDGRNHARTEPQKRYYIPTATRCAGIIILLFIIDWQVLISICVIMVTEWIRKNKKHKNKSIGILPKFAKINRRKNIQIYGIFFITKYWCGPKKLP